MQRIITESESTSTLDDLWTPEACPTYVGDWDSTFCEQETLDFLAGLVHGDDEEVMARFHSVTEQGMDGDMSFSESLRERFKLIRIRREHVAEAAQLLTEHVDPTAIERRDCIERNNDRIHVVSGGFEELITPSLGLLGIDPAKVHANKFAYDEDGFVVGADCNRLTSQDDGKALQVAELCLEGLVIAIGDGFNDYRIKALGHADIFVAYTRHRARQSVVPLADAAVDSFAEPLFT